MELENKGEIPLGTVQHHPLVQTMLLLGKLTEQMAEHGLETTEQEVVADLIPRRTLFSRRRYFEPVKQTRHVIFPSCTFLVTACGQVGRHLMEYRIDGERCTDKKGRPVGGWIMVTDIGQLTMRDLEHLNRDLLKASLV